MIQSGYGGLRVVPSPHMLMTQPDALARAALCSVALAGGIMHMAENEQPVIRHKPDESSATKESDPHHERRRKIANNTGAGSGIGKRPPSLY